MFKYKKKKLLIGDEAIVERTALRYKVAKYDTHCNREVSQFIMFSVFVLLLISHTRVINL